MGEKMQFTELDQYLFGQGTHEQFKQSRIKKAKGA